MQEHLRQLSQLRQCITGHHATIAAAVVTPITIIHFDINKFIIKTSHEIMIPGILALHVSIIVCLH